VSSKRIAVRGVFLALAGVSFVDPARALSGRTEVEGRASAQGAAAARALAEASSESLALRLGAESAAAPGAPLRHALLAGATASWAAWDVSLDARGAPAQSGSAALGAELSARRDLGPLAITASAAAHRSAWLPCPPCAERSLAAAGGGLEAEATLGPSWRAAVHAAAFAIELRDGPPARRTARAVEDQPDPWQRYSAFTLDWPERWDAGARLLNLAGPWELSAALGVGAPPQDGALFFRAGGRVQRSFGAWTAALGANVARVQPQGQLWAEVSATIGVRIGPGS
jgi:hypothetical protein